LNATDAMGPVHRTSSPVPAMTTDWKSVVQ